ncbi:MAG: polyprenyl synthetase family protein [Gemmatimonadota bacterium]|nr:polyprenyl synthetase family protein [Gemmatimonadota bacterium]
MADVAAWSSGEDRVAIDAALAAVCASNSSLLPAPVSDAVAYSLLGGGKRLRGLLLLETYRAAGGRDDALQLAAAIEIVHAYSLIHDDLPCMDDEDVRRGRATVHVAFGVRAATAAGLAMVPLAVACASDAAQRLQLPGSVGGRIVRTLMQASGAGGMIGGQLLDLEGERTRIALAELERVHLAKTGALIAAAARVGGIAAGAAPAVEAALDHFGAALGLAFQIADDVLDVTATAGQLGKTPGRDAALQKTTYPALLGVTEAIRRADALASSACAGLRQAGLLTPSLARLTRFAVERRA